jgi:hypothetical protein
LIGTCNGADRAARNSGIALAIKSDDSVIEYGTAPLGVGNHESNCRKIRSRKVSLPVPLTMKPQLCADLSRCAD